VSICPKCQRTFDEGTGYCPFDGTHTVKDLEPGAPAPVRPQLVIDSRAPGRVNEYDRLVGQTLDSRYLSNTASARAAWASSSAAATS
jgi:hypothetical protein